MTDETVNVNVKRQEYKQFLPYWTQIADCLQGEMRVKAKRETYLPYPYQDRNDRNNSLYQNYLLRSQFINVIRRTIGELVGYVFMKEPTIKVAANSMIIQSIIDNASGNGVDLISQSKQALETVVTFERAGLFVDFPVIEGSVTLDSVERGEYRPTITVYNPFQIINWRVEEVGSEERLSLVVLKELKEFAKNDIETELRPVIRVLTIKDNVYRQHIYIGGDVTNSVDGSMFNEDIISNGGYDMDNSNGYELVETITPTDANGNTFDRIPFTFIGASNNSSKVNVPLMYDLSTINISHYHNSADYEESLFLCGQPTLFVSGFKGARSACVQQNETVNNQITLGSRSAITMENGGTASLLQFKADSALEKALISKQEQMVNFGAKFLEKNTVQKTAYQVKTENQLNGSILSNCADNVSIAFTQALQFIHDQLGLNMKVDFKLNTAFEYNKITIDELNFAMNAYTNGTLAFEEIRQVLRNSGFATEDDSVAKRSIDDNINKEYTNNNPTNGD